MRLLIASCCSKGKSLHVNIFFVAFGIVTVPYLTWIDLGSPESTMCIWAVRGKCLKSTSSNNIALCFDLSNCLRSSMWVTSNAGLGMCFVAQVVFPVPEGPMTTIESRVVSDGFCECSTRFITPGFSSVISDSVDFLLLFSSQ